MNFNTQKQTSNSSSQRNRFLWTKKKRWFTSLLTSHRHSFNVKKKKQKFGNKSQCTLKNCAEASFSPIQTLRFKMEDKKTPNIPSAMRAPWYCDSEQHWQKCLILRVVQINGLIGPQFGVLDFTSFKSINQSINPPEQPFVSPWHPKDSSLHRYKGLLTSSHLGSELDLKLPGLKPPQALIWCHGLLTPDFVPTWKHDPFKLNGKMTSTNPVSYASSRSLSREIKRKVSAETLHIRTPRGRKRKEKILVPKTCSKCVIVQNP